MLDRVFILVLLLNLTGLSYFIAPQLNVDIATVSIVLLVSNCLYITANHKVTRHIFRKKHIFYWFIFLLIWPLLATIYAPAVNFRELGLQVYYFTLLLATAVYILRNGFKSFHQIITVAFAITILGLILSMFMGTHFGNLASIEQKDLIRYQGRAYGFFMQPNMAALSLNLLFVIWYAGLRKTKILTMFLSLFGLFVLVSLTGSRAGYVVAVAVVFLIFINRSIRIRKSFQILISPKSFIIFFLVICCFQVCIPIILSLLTAHLPKRVIKFDVIARMKAISQMKLAEKTIDGKSTVAKRMEVFWYYFAMIRERPILGYGFGSKNFLQAKGILSRSSHNQYLEIVFETGIFRLAFFLLFLFSIYIYPGRKRTEQFLCTNSYAQLLTVIILTGMFSSMVLKSRILYCAVGCFIAMLISPQIITDDVALEESSQKPEDAGNLRIQNER